MCNFSSELENFTYVQLKELLKQEYLLDFKEYVEWSITEKERLISQKFGFEFCKNQERLHDLKAKVDFIFDEFYKSKNYKDAQNLVATLNQRILFCNSEEKQEIEEELKKALSKIETLNVTIKNRTKNEREEIETLKFKVDAIELKYKNELESIDKQVESLVVKKLSDTVTEYNQILQGLSSIYDVEPPKTKEYPFTEEELLEKEFSTETKKGVISFIKQKFQN